MLAYVFWHQPASIVTQEEYQLRLVAYHCILQERHPQGFISSFVLQLSALPWMAADRETYEDWYLVENSAALDSLDEAAVSGICCEPHYQVARLASTGTGGLYRLKAGTFSPTNFQYATWFNKPVGMSYDQLYSLLGLHQFEPEYVLWQRKMTMGPGLEFCLHSPGQIVLPTQITAIQQISQPIYQTECGNTPGFI